MHLAINNHELKGQSLKTCLTKMETTYHRSPEEFKAPIIEEEEEIKGTKNEDTLRNEQKVYSKKKEAKESKSR